MLIWGLGSVPTLFSSGIGIALLFVAFVIERVNSKPPAPELSSMELMRKKVSSIDIDSGELVICDKWSLEAASSLRIPHTPPSLEVVIDFRISDHHCVLTAIEFTSEDAPAEKAKELVTVDTGVLYFIDRQATRDLVSAKQLEEITMKMFNSKDRFTSKWAPITDPQGRVRGIACVTGIGDGSYRVTWGAGSTWSMRVQFL